MYDKVHVDCPVHWSVVTLVGHSVPVKVWTRCADGDFLELTTEIPEVHPELSIILHLHPHHLLRLLVHPVPA